MTFSSCISEQFPDGSVFIMIDVEMDNAIEKEGSWFREPNDIYFRFGNND